MKHGLNTDEEYELFSFSFVSVFHLCFIRGSPPVFSFDWLLVDENEFLGVDQDVAQVGPDAFVARGLLGTHSVFRTL